MISVYPTARSKMDFNLRTALLLTTCSLIYINNRIGVFADELLISPINSFLNQHDNSLLDEYHLPCCCLEGMPQILKIVRDYSTNGKIITIDGLGFKILDWLSHEFHFTYECTESGIYKLGGKQRETNPADGLIKNLEIGACELIISSMGVTYDRFLHVDFLHPHAQEPVGMLIPAPVKSFMNLDAIWKPFQSHVWIALFICMALTTVTLVILDFRSCQRGILNGLNSYGLFVFQTVASQSPSVRGGLFSGYYTKRLKMRLVIGAWCLTSLLLITAYSSVLSSFIVAPHYHTLVDTVEQLAKNEKVTPLVFKGYHPDILISTSKDPMMKKIAAKLNGNPSNRCLNVTSCRSQVKRGSHVYIDLLSQIAVGVQQDLAKTGECNFALAKESFYPVYLSWGIRKEHHLTEKLNRGSLRLMETGLMDKWFNRSNIYPDKCNQFKKSNGHLNANGGKTNPSRLTISHLMGPFLMLLVGYLIALLMLGAEIIFHMLTNLAFTVQQMVRQSNAMVFF